MLYKEVLCPSCEGYGFTTISDENSISSRHCNECNGHGTVTVPMTNGDIIRTCTNEQLVKVYYKLQQTALYSSDPNKRLLYSSEEDFLLWLNKESDDIDIKTIFDFIDEKDNVHQMFIRGQIYEKGSKINEI